jgi:hypothetical protein
VDWLLVAIPIVLLVFFYWVARDRYPDRSELYGDAPPLQGPPSMGVREPRRPPPGLDRGAVAVDPADE